MTTTLSWPERIPLPTIPGYGIKPKPNIDRTEVEIGSARQRKRSTTTNDPVTVQFELTAWEYMILDGWLDTRAGASWFNMPLLSGRGLETWEVRVLGGLERDDRPRNGARWVCSLTLEVRNRPKLSSAELEILIEEDSTAFFLAMAAFDHLVNQEFPSP